MTHEELVKNILGDCESFEEYEVAIAAGLKDPADVVEDILLLLEVIKLNQTIVER